MKKYKNLVYLFILFQLGILILMVLQSMAPLRNGQEILLRIEAKDPRALFRGNYVVLNYAFQSLDVNSIEHDLQDMQTFTYGDKLYLEMEKHGEFWEPVALKQTLPESPDNVYMKVTVQHHFRYEIDEYPDFIWLDAGISSYFTPKDKALELEKIALTASEDHSPLTVTVKVGKNGEARIKALNVVE